MINIPQIQNQERLSMDKQVKNIRTYLFQLAQDLQRTLSGMQSDISTLKEENAELKEKLAEKGGR